MSSAAPPNDSSMAAPVHPYFPPDLVLPGYAPNEVPVPTLIASFAGAALLVFWATSLLARTVRPGISRTDLFTAMWFMLCGCIHLFFEGYFARHNASMASRTDLFGQLWKEYAKSDRRYLTRDSFTVCMETVTAAAWGPLSFLLGWLAIRDHPLRHPLQIAVSLGQLYGDVLYYAIFFFDEAVYGAVYCRPEGYYFWAYFVLMNGFWIVFPGLLIWHSTVESVKAFRAVKEAGRRGTVKGM